MNSKDIQELFLHHADSIYPGNSIPKELKKIKIKNYEIQNTQYSSNFYQMTRESNVGGNSIYSEINTKNIHIFIIPKLVMNSNVKENILNNHYKFESYLEFQISVVSHSKLNNVYITGMFDGRIYIWNCDNNSLITKVSNHKYKIFKFLIEESLCLPIEFAKNNSQSLHSTSSLMITISERGEYNIWDLSISKSTSTQLVEFEEEDSGKLNHISVKENIIRNRLELDENSNSNSLIMNENQNEFENKLLISFNSLENENLLFEQKYKFDDENMIVLLDVKRLEKITPLLIQISNDNKISIINYQTGIILKKIGVKSNILNCINFLEAYGKIIIGTKDKTIIDIEIKGILDELKIPNNYNKNPFLTSKVNVELDYLDAQVDHKKVADLITKKLF